MKELKELGITKRQLNKIIGEKKYKPKIIKEHLSANTFQFGIVSDTHLCSRLAKLDELYAFYEICRKEGISHIMHAGDIIEGWGIYKGQENEVHTFGATNQVNYVVEHYPKVKGITTHFITGNHCLSWWNKSGIEIGELVSSKRPDMDYLGQYGATFTLNGVKIRLHHGEGGGSYALSYKPQKILEQIPSGEKPHIMIFGHWHTSFYFFYRLIHSISAGAFQGQSTYLLRKGLNPSIGGWIIKVKVANDIKRTILSITPTFIPFI